MLRQAWNGDFKSFHDITIQSWSPTSVWITTATALRPGDVLDLDVGSGPDAAQQVQATMTVPVVDEGEMCHRVRLDPVTALDGAPGPSALGRHALLWQLTPIRLIEISRGGCRVESPTPLPVGCTGRLRIFANEHQFNDHIRVAWCRCLEGAGSVYRAGIELFPPVAAIASADNTSLRDAVALLADASGM